MKIISINAFVIDSLYSLQKHYELLDSSWEILGLSAHFIFVVALPLKRFVSRNITRSWNSSLFVIYLFFIILWILYD